MLTLIIAIAAAVIDADLADHVALQWPGQSVVVYGGCWGQCSRKVLCYL